jgi:alpha-L-arabinofuranosidase
MIKKSALILVYFLFSIAAFSTPAAINVDYSTVVNPYHYRMLLGNNLGYWIAPAAYTANTAKINAAGSYLLRFPGGSNSDNYHWNGNGSYDANNIWHPSQTVYAPGFQANLLRRGTTSSYGNPSVLADGDTSSANQWVSDTITAAGATTNAYVIVMLPSAKAVNQVNIYWGNTYSVNYEIQYWNNYGNYGWAPHMANTSSWTTILTVTNGAGGTDIRAIPSTTAQVFRILMHASSGVGYKMNEIMLYNGSTRVTVNENDMGQTTIIASPTDLENSNYGWTPAFGFETYMTLINSMGGKAIPACTVNFGTGTPEEAAAWVYYANIVQKYGIKYWQVGNEMDGTWETGGPVDAQYYAARFVKFADAMKAVDPTIKICGPVISSIQINSELYDGQSYIDTFLQNVQAAGKLPDLDVIDFHIYANWSNTDAATTLDTPNNWFGESNYKSFIDNLQTKYYGSTTAKEVYMSEHNSGGATLLAMQFPMTLWMVNWIGEYAKAFGTRADASLWDVMNNNASTGNYDQGFLEIGQQTGAYQYQQRATYWGMYIFNNLFGVADDNGNTLVSASSNQALLPVYANKRSDGKLSVMVVNKDSANAYQAVINIAGYTPDPSADLYTFAASASAPYYINNYQWFDSTPSSYADPDLAPQASNINFAASSFSFTFPAYSISVMNFVPVGSSPTITPTISPTGTITQTPTITPTPIPQQFNIIDNCENEPSNANLWGGTWYSYSDSYGTGSAITSASKVAGGSPLSPIGSYAVTGTLGTNSGSNYVYIGWGTGFPSTNLYNYTGLYLYVKGDGKSYDIKVQTSNITDSGYYQYTFTAPAAWTQYYIPFSAMTQPGFASAKPFDLSAVTAIQWDFTGQGQSFSINVDDIAVYQPAGTPTNTPTGTKTVTPTRTITNTITPTITTTVSMTYTVTNTLTITLTPTITPTFTPMQGIGKQNNLNKAYVYPSYYDARTAKNDGVYFYGLTSATRLEVYSLTGGLVYSDSEATPDGLLFMKIRGLVHAKTLSSGLYVYALTDAAGDNKMGKFVIIR